MKTRFLLLLIFAVLPAATQACLWDRNTLEAEVKGLPDVVQIITGRFERNPPLFYEMRLERTKREIALKPEALEAYDDAGVACDRLNRDEDAIGWMQQKRKILERLDQKNENVRDHWYRYYANIGTFRVHHWLRNGADRTKIAEVKAARNEIAEGIKINPDAHFGREKVQLAVMDWLINPTLPDRGENSKSRKKVVLLSEYLHFGEKPEKIRKGLLGLIVLGNAWESVDIFDAVALSLSDEDSSLIEEMAVLRVDELQNQGHHSLVNTEKTSLGYIPNKSTVVTPHELQQAYVKLRQEANAWQQHRTGYMMTRLKAGRHPDTDPTFWKDWHDAGPPAVHTSLKAYLAYLFTNPSGFVFALTSPVFLFYIVSKILLWRKIRKRRRNLQPPQRI